jgi:hypothetical protein
MYVVHFDNNVGSKKCWKRDQYFHNLCASSIIWILITLSWSCLELMDNSMLQSC